MVGEAKYAAQPGIRGYSSSVASFGMIVATTPCETGTPEN